MNDTVSLREPNAVHRAPRKDALIGVELDGYVITRPISSGGMGVVYEARHPQVGRRVAVKVMRPEHCQNAALTGRFSSEIRALSAIRQRNVVEILSFGLLPDGGQFLMMEFVEGETLGDLIERAGTLGAGLALQICEDILSGLAAVHEMGIAHRDLKPANVLLCGRGSGELTVKVCDFGLARQFANRDGAANVEPATAQPEDGASTVAGTPEYISPEQASGRSVSGQADLYCLGVMIFEMLTGRLPFEGRSAIEMLNLHCCAAPPHLGSLVVGLPPALDALIDSLLAKAPEGRPAGARATLKIVRSLRETLPELSKPIPVGPNPVDERTGDAITGPAVTLPGTAQASN